MKNDNYIMIMGWMIKVVGLAPGAEREIYAIIHGFCQDGKSEFLGSIKYLSDFSGYGRTTVINTLNKMYSRGDLIKRSFYEKDGQKRCAYATAISRMKVEASNLTVETYQALLTRYKTGTCLNTGGTKNEPESSTNSELPWYKNCTVPSTESVPNISNINSKYKSSSFSENNGEVKNVFSEKINEIFTRNPFDRNFTGELKSAFSEYGIDEKRAGEYLDFVYRITLEHNPKSVTNFFRNIAVRPNVLQDFAMKVIEDEKKTAERHLELTEICPVCGEKASKFSRCKNCDFDMEMKSDKSYVDEQKKIMSLPPKKKEAFEKELSEFYTCNLSFFLNPQKRLEKQKMEREIKIKYGIISEKNENPEETEA